jgi:mannose-6-phosphate isomerase-like protein (cupin superfamily)
MPLMNNATPRIYDDIPGVRFAPIAAPSRGTAENAMWRAIVAPHAEGLLHHMTREEIILAVAGEGRIRIGDDSHPLRPGDAFAVPAFTDFQLEAAGDTPFEAVVVLPVGGRGVIAGRPAFVPPWSV